MEDQKDERTESAGLEMWDQKTMTGKWRTIGRKLIT